MTALGAGPHSTVSARGHHTQGREKPLPRPSMQAARGGYLVVPSRRSLDDRAVHDVAGRRDGAVCRHADAWDAAPPVRASLPLNHFQRIVTPSAGSTTAYFSGARKAP